MIRILAMSDSHRQHQRFTLPDADLFIHAGDFTNFGNGAEEFAIWYWQLPYKKKLVVLGNHETANAVEKRDIQTWRKLFGPTLLDNEAQEVELGGKKFVVFGAPYGTLDFSAAPTPASIVVTHEPPYRILDNASGGHIGEPAIGEFVRSIRPSIHLFGHAHAPGGHSAIESGILFVNAATRAVLIEAGEETRCTRTIHPRRSSKTP